MNCISLPDFHMIKVIFHAFIFCRDIKMILEKQMEYSISQIEEFQKMFKELNDSGKIYITEDDVKRAVFGPPIREEDMKTRSLAKMYHDIYNQLGIYPVTARPGS